MIIMTLQEQQMQEQNNKGYFTMPDSPSQEEYITAIEDAFEEHQQEQFENIIF